MKHCLIYFLGIMSWDTFRNIGRISISERMSGIKVFVINITKNTWLTLTHAPYMLIFYKSKMAIFWDVSLYHHHHYHWLDSPAWALAFLISFCLLKYPAIASSDFMTNAFRSVSFSAPRPTPGIHPGRPMFSVRVVSLRWLVPILKRQYLASCLCMTWPYKRCPGAMTCTCMQRTW
jgi:hypothetical protein